jgi:ATP adenylyltransferase
MDYLWSPWRYRYITEPGPQQGCIFCNAGSEAEATYREASDRQNLVLFRGHLGFVILNRYPYTSGHLMIAPFQHTHSLTLLADETTTEMMTLTRRALAALESEYKPDGFNVGLNLGTAAGAGIAEHIHMHVVPRWIGDANFVSVIGETRVLPEELTATFDRLKRHFTV